MIDNNYTSEAKADKAVAGVLMIQFDMDIKEAKGLIIEAFNRLNGQTDLTMLDVLKQCYEIKGESDE